MGHLIPAGTGFKIHQAFSIEKDVSGVLPVFAKKEYDLCGHCYAKFLSDPLGLDSRRKLPFSRN